MTETTDEASGGAVFPLNRTNWDFGKLWDYAWACFKREWLTLSAAGLIFLVVVACVSGMISLFNAGMKFLPKEAAALGILAVVVAQVIGQVVNGFVEMGLYRLYLDVLSGQRGLVERLFSQFPKLGVYIVQRLLIVLFFGVPMMAYYGVLLMVAVMVSGGISDLSGLGDRLAHSPVAIAILVFGFVVSVVPLAYFAVPLYFATLEIVNNEGVGAMESLQNCFAIAKGNRLPIIGVSMVSGLIILCGLFVCCVGVLPAIALGQSLMTGLYLALRNGSGLKESTRQPL